MIPIITITDLQVTYSTTINNVEIEFEGTLIPYNTGRAINYKFDPYPFDDEASGTYYDESWETIEEEILNAYYQSLKLQTK